MCEIVSYYLGLSSILTILWPNPILYTFYKTLNFYLNKIMTENFYSSGNREMDSYNQSQDLAAILSNMSDKLEGISRLEKS